MIPKTPKITSKSSKKAYKPADIINCRIKATCKSYGRNVRTDPVATMQWPDIPPTLEGLISYSKENLNTSQLRTLIAIMRALWRKDLRALTREIILDRRQKIEGPGKIVDNVQTITQHTQILSFLAFIRVVYRCRGKTFYPNAYTLHPVFKNRELRMRFMLWSLKAIAEKEIPPRRPEKSPFEVVTDIFNSKLLSVCKSLGTVAYVQKQTHSLSKFLNIIQEQACPKRSALPQGDPYFHKTSPALGEILETDWFEASLDVDRLLAKRLEKPLCLEKMVDTMCEYVSPRDFTTGIILT